MDSFGRGYSGEIYRLRDAVDGVQVMWPLPKHIDSARVFNAGPLSKDVDGICLKAKLQYSVLWDF